jgi:hypothetical protein
VSEKNVLAANFATDTQLMVNIGEAVQNLYQSKSFKQE